MIKDYVQRSSWPIVGEQRTCVISDLEFGLELPELGAVDGHSHDVDVVLKGRSNGGDIEAEVAGPNLTDNAGGDGAVAVVGVGSFASAVVGLVEDLSAHKVAHELDVIESGARDVPDTLDEEFLGVVGLDGIGARVGALGNDGEVLSASDLVDSNGVAGNGLNHERLVGSDNGGKSGSKEGSHCVKENQL